jgi:hypothetical protein
MQWGSEPNEITALATGHGYDQGSEFRSAAVPQSAEEPSPTIAWYRYRVTGSRHGSGNAPLSDA